MPQGLITASSSAVANSMLLFFMQDVGQDGFRVYNRARNASQYWLPTRVGDVAVTGCHLNCRKQQPQELRREPGIDLIYAGCAAALLQRSPGVPRPSIYPLVDPK